MNHPLTNDHENSIIEKPSLIFNYWQTNTIIRIQSLKNHPEKSISEKLKTTTRIQAFTNHRQNSTTDKIKHDNSIINDNANSIIKILPRWIYYCQSSTTIIQPLKIHPENSKIVKPLKESNHWQNTMSIVLGPCTALCSLFLKHCTLTNKAVGTIWRALSKPPQRRQGPDLRPLWLLVGIPSVIRPELAFSRAEHSLPYSDVTIYIFAILYLSSMPYV